MTVPHPVDASLEDVERNLAECPSQDYPALKRLLHERTRLLAELQPGALGFCLPDTLELMQRSLDNGRKLAARLGEARVEAAREYAELGSRQQVLKGFRQPRGNSGKRLNYLV
jgi:hypothetical protein